MRRLNNLNAKFFPQDQNCFVPKVIEIITADQQQARRSVDVKAPRKEVDLTQICVVLEYIDTDLD